MPLPKKPSSSEPQSKPTETPEHSSKPLSPKQRRLVGGTMAILGALRNSQEREAMEQAQEVIAKAARKD